jgi:hypothetical protein
MGNPSAAIVAMAAYRLWVVRLPQQLTSSFEDRNLGFQLTDALIGRSQLGLLSTIETGQLPSVDQLLFAPAVDRLVTDAQIGSDLGDRADAGHQIENLAAELLGITLRHGHGAPSKDVVTKSQANRLRATAGTSP